MTTTSPSLLAKHGTPPHCPDCGEILRITDEVCFYCPSNCGFYHVDELAERDPWQVKPPTPRPSTMTPALQAIADERASQLLEHGWTIEHDDQHTDGSLTKAAKCYIETAALQIEKGIAKLPPCFIHKDWPWDRQWWKPSDDPRVNLRKGAALTLAEMERIDRLAAKLATNG